MSAAYVPNDSPFGECLEYWLHEGRIRSALECYDHLTLDEFASCASSLLSRPCYADDQRLRRFREELLEVRDAKLTEIHVAESRYADDPMDAASGWCFR